MTEREAGRYVQDFSKEAARLHGKLPAHARAIARAAGRVREAMASAPGTWALGCSGGKDSAAMIAIAVEAGWRGPVHHVEYGGDYDAAPTENARAIADRFGLPFASLTVMSEMEAIDAAGCDPHAGPDGWGDAARLWERTHKRQIAEFQARQSWSGLFLGLRAEESRVRRMVLRRKGHLYATAARPFLTCCPLCDWSARDVWAAILARGLPYLDRYDAAADRERERSDDAWFTARVWGHGMAARMRAHDPQGWRRLVERYPGLAREI